METPLNREKKRMGTCGLWRAAATRVVAFHFFLTKSKKGIDNRRKLWYNRIVGNKFSFYVSRSRRMVWRNFNTFSYTFLLKGKGL